MRRAERMTDDFSFPLNIKWRELPKFRNWCFFVRFSCWLLIYTRQLQCFLLRFSSIADTTTMRSSRKTLKLRPSIMKFGRIDDILQNVTHLLLKERMNYSCFFLSFCMNKQLKLCVNVTKTSPQQLLRLIH